VSELTNLKLANVDLERSQIKITRKGDKEQYLHLNGEAVSVLVKYLYSRPHHMRLPRFARNDEGLWPQAQNGRFFVGTKGQNLGGTYVYELVRRYLKLAGINKGKQGPHLLRHTFCTRLYQKGVAPFVIKELAGHKSLNTTMRYVGIENKEQSEALDRLEFGTMNL
jgi:integrase/recombinase XerD